MSDFDPQSYKQRPRSSAPTANKGNATTSSQKQQQQMKQFTNEHQPPLTAHINGGRKQKMIL